MPAIPWKLVFGLTVPAVGAGVAYPIATRLGGAPEPTIPLENLQHFKDLCWVSIVGGDEGQTSESNRKLLVCPANEDSSRVRFYFYNESTSNQLPKEVQKLTFQDQENVIVTIFFDQRKENIYSNNNSWKFLYGRDLRETCKVNWQEETKKIECKGHKYIRALTQFKTKNNK